MKLPSTLLGSLAAALAGLGLTGCEDSTQTKPATKPTPRARATEVKGSPLNLVNPDGCPGVEQQPGGNPGGNNQGAPCPGCGMG
jgi:hypothetical protein